MDWMKALYLRAEQDEHYQQLLEAVRVQEANFLALRESLSMQQQEVLDAYLSACEELDHALVLLAYNLEKEG